MAGDKNLKIKFAVRGAHFIWQKSVKQIRSQVDIVEYFKAYLSTSFTDLALIGMRQVLSFEVSFAFISL